MDATTTRRDRNPWVEPGPFVVRDALVPAWAQSSGDDVAVNVQYPETDDTSPRSVIVLCHGLGGSHRAYAALGTHLASHGYVVVHPQFLDAFELVAPRLGLVELGLEGWARDERARSLMRTLLFDPKHWVSRVDRVHAVLGTLDSQRHVHVTMRGERVIIAGHSFGAYTTQLVLGARLVGVGLEDRNFAHPAAAAGVLMSPQGSGDRGLVESSWDTVRDPLLVVTATGDLGPHAEGLDWRRQPFEHARSAYKHLVVIKEGNHSLGGIAVEHAQVEGTTDARVRRALAGIITAFADRVHGDVAGGEWLATGPCSDLLDHEHWEKT